MRRELTDEELDAYGAAVWRVWETETGLLCELSGVGGILKHPFEVPKKGIREKFLEIFHRNPEGETLILISRGDLRILSVGEYCEHHGWCFHDMDETPARRCCSD